MYLGRNYLLIPHYWGESQHKSRVKARSKEGMQLGRAGGRLSAPKLRLRSLRSQFSHPDLGIAASPSPRDKLLQVMEATTETLRREFSQQQTD